MLCESRLWTVAFCQDWDGPSDACKTTPVTTATTSGCVPVTAPVPPSPRLSTRTLPSPRQQPRDSLRQLFPAESPRLLEPHAQACRLASPGLDAPGRDASPRSPPAAEPFLVPPSCRSICQDYSDLCIAGDQVLLLGGAQDVDVGVGVCTGDLQGSLCQDPGAGCGPEQGLASGGPGREGEGEVLLPWGEEDGALVLGAARERERERPSLAAVERPLSDAQLNRYLEQKLLELYRQHLTQGPATLWPATATPAGLERPPGPPPLLLASELLQSSLDQITLQLRPLEAGRAKDMLMSCLLRVASSLQSSQISTPLLQISTETTP
ncbi:hypothetical protein ACEWY4_022719 [Coilia grayii]|uniref:Uncharacterized protein n=1 Tax=Coilia grayii TaxID=363190 RepID=A0ABD1J2K0_9TELE